VEVDVRVRPFEHPVLVPLRLSNVKSIASRRECRQVRRFVRRVGHDENDVNDGLSWQTRHGRRADMLNSQRLLRKDGPDPSGLTLEQFGPSWIVVDEHNAAVQWLHFSNMRGVNLFRGQRAVAVSQRSPPTPDYSRVVA